MDTQPVPVEQPTPATPPLESGRPEPGSLAERGRQVRIAPIPPSGAAAPVAAPDQEPPQEQPPQKFTFGGYEFDSAEAAEHAFRSQDGRVRALTQKLQAYAEALAATQGRGPVPGAQPAITPQPGAAPGPPQPDGPWYENDAMWERYKTLATEQGPDYAGYFLVRQMWENFEKVMADRLDKRVGPIEQTAQVAHAYQDTMGVVNELTTKADESGALVYPELSSTSPQVLQELTQLWQEMGGYKAGQRSWHMAVLEYRFRHGPPTQTPPVDANGQAPAPGGMLPRAFVVPSAPVPMPGHFPLAGGNGTPRRDAGPMDPAEALVRGMTGAVNERKTPDGFSLGSFRR